MELAKAVVTACDKPNTFSFLTPEGTPLVAADRGDRHEDLRRGRHRPADAGGEGPRAHREARARHGAGLHGEDADVAVARSRTCATGRRGFIVPVRSLVPSLGAGFVIALCGEMQRMPGLGKTPAFQKMDIDENGNTLRVVLSSGGSAAMAPARSGTRPTTARPHPATTTLLYPAKPRRPGAASKAGHASGPGVHTRADPAIREFPAALRTPTG